MQKCLCLGWGFRGVTGGVTHARPQIPAGAAFEPAFIVGAAVTESLSVVFLQALVSHRRRSCSLRTEARTSSFWFWPGSVKTRPLTSRKA